jgi:hypothetical protein
MLKLDHQYETTDDKLNDFQLLIRLLYIRIHLTDFSNRCMIQQMNQMNYDLID